MSRCLLCLLRKAERNVGQESKVSLSKSIHCNKLNIPGNVHFAFPLQAEKARGEMGEVMIINKRHSLIIEFYINKCSVNYDNQQEKNTHLWK